MKKMRSILALLLALTLSLSLTACGGGTKPGNDTSDPAPGGAQANREEGSLIFSIDWPAYIDPGVGNKAADMVAHLNLYDTLTFPLSDGTVAPLLAESWEANSEATEYTFHLVENAKFHSGNPVTAQDVKFSMDRLLAMGEGYAYLFSNIASTEVVDEHTIKFTLSESSGALPNILIRLYILEKAVVMEHIDAGGAYGEFGDYGKAWLTTNDAGSGPYTVREMRMEDSLTMVRVEDYWRGWTENPNAPKVVIALGNVDATTVKTMVSRNELDITSNTLTKETLDSVAAVSGMALVRAKSGLSMNIALNTKVAPTDDIHFRKAMAYALDYNTVSTSIYPDSTQPTGPIVSGAACALKQEDNPYTFDLDKAVAELKQSPYYQELTSGSMVVSLTYCSEGGQPQEQLALLMQAGLAAIGIKCEITAKPFANMMTDAATVETTPNASFIVYSPSYMEGGSFLKPRYHSSSSGTWEQMEWLLDDELDAEIERAMNIVDEDERNTAYIQICKELVELCPTIWACDVASSYAYRSDYMRIPSVEAGYDALYCADYMMYYRDYTLK